MINNVCRLCLTWFTWFEKEKMVTDFNRGSKLKFYHYVENSTDETEWLSPFSSPQLSGSASRATCRGGEPRRTSRRRARGIASASRVARGGASDLGRAASHEGAHPAPHAHRAHCSFFSGPRWGSTDAWDLIFFPFI